MGLQTTGRDGDAFINELRTLVGTRPSRWLIFDNFNLIYVAADRSNSNLNRRLMGRFKATLDAMRLWELNLTERKFTWSNDAMMTRIDMIFCSDEWDVLFPFSILQALPSSILDHVPLLMIGAADIPKFATLRFETF